MKQRTVISTLLLGMAALALPLAVRLTGPAPADGPAATSAVTVTADAAVQAVPLDLGWG